MIKVKPDAIRRMAGESLSDRDGQHADAAAFPRLDDIGLYSFSARPGF